jgi:ribonuclease BN (tRNA processing enzyme)
MNVIFLGTNGWYDTHTGNTISVLVRSRRHDIILDAGNGFYKTEQYIPPGDEKPAYLFLSHFHLDHIIGLHTLAKGRFPLGLTLCGPTGTRAVLDQILDRPFTVSLDRLPYPTAVYELPEEVDKLPFAVDARELRHSGLTLGYRFSLDDRVIAYCADTGYCENAVALARSADLLIAECAYKSGQSDESWPHLNPETAARIAAEAGARRLALIHFDAQTHPTLRDRKDSEQAAQSIFPNAFATFDDMQVDV